MIKVKALFIDEDSSMMEVYRHLVSWEGWEDQSGFADSTVDAHELLDKNQYDVVIADSELGNGNGFDIISLSGESPVVFVGGAGNEEVAVKALKWGIFDYLPKNGNAQKFSVKLARIIKRAARFHQLNLQLKDTERDYGLLVESANVIIAKTDRLGRLSFLNREGNKLLEAENQKLEGSHFVRLVHPEYRVTIQEFYRSMFEHGQEESYLEVPLLGPKEESIWVSLRVRAIHANDQETAPVIGYLAVALDIRDRIEKASQIKAQNIELESTSEELRRTMELLIQARIGRKAMAIVVVIAVVLFIVSEGFLEPLVENASNDAYIGFIFKGAIALLLKPIDLVVERYLTYRILGNRKQLSRKP